MGLASNQRDRVLHLWVGLFVLVVGFALAFLAVRASHTDVTRHGPSFTIHANFTNVSGLRVRAPVLIAGVSVGTVETIALNPQTYEADVTMRITQGQSIPSDSSAAIMTEGLLGAKYVSISPGFSASFLEPGGILHKTTPAFVLEKAIGQLLFSSKGRTTGAQPSTS